MKRIVLTTITALLVACGYNKEEQMLYDYVNDGVKKALNTDVKNIGFKIVEFKKIQEITAKDSLAMLEPYLEKEKMSGLLEIKQTLSKIYDAKEKSLSNLSEALKIGTKDAKNFAEEIKADIKKFDTRIENLEKLEKSYNEDFAGTEHESVYKKIQEYKTNENKILSTKYLGKHSIKNPLLNNVEQTIEKYYFTNSENTKIVESVDVE